jgi:hypothetical protein
VWEVAFDFTHGHGIFLVFDFNNRCRATVFRSKNRRGCYYFGFCKENDGGFQETEVLA